MPKRHRDEDDIARSQRKLVKYQNIIDGKLAATRPPPDDSSEGKVSFSFFSLCQDNIKIIINRIVINSFYAADYVNYLI